jgi:hypothetical protein
MVSKLAVILALVWGVGAPFTPPVYGQGSNTEYCNNLNALFGAPRFIASTSIYRAGYDTGSPHAQEVLNASNAMMVVIAAIAHRERVERNHLMNGEEFSVLLVYAASSIMDRGDGWIYTPNEEAYNNRDAEITYCSREA